MAQYEFNERENQQIHRVERKLRHISILFGLLGAVQFAGAFLPREATGRWISVGAAALLLSLGWLFMRPLDNFRRIIVTTGQDIHQVMIAMKDLRAAYRAAEVIFAIFVAGIIVEFMRLWSAWGF